MKFQKWAGRISTGLITALFLATAVAKMAGGRRMSEGLIHAGIPAGAIVPIALLELFCLAVYLHPRTVGLGAVLLTGYFGGIVVTHLVSGGPIVPLIAMGAVMWAGAFFRRPELGVLLPRARRRTQTASSESGIWRGSEA